MTRQNILNYALKATRVNGSKVLPDKLRGVFTNQDSCIVIAHMFLYLVGETLSDDHEFIAYIVPVVVRFLTSVCY